MTRAMTVYENRQRFRLKQLQKAYRDWIESNALLDAFRRSKNRGGLEINYYAINKRREKREMDEAEESQD